MGYGLGYGYPYYDDYYYRRPYTAATYEEVPAEAGAVTGDGAAYCAKRFKSYNPRTGTYIAKGGRRVACP